MKTVILLAVLIALSSCSMFKPTQVEMPTDPEGSDEMRKSPCACYKLDFDGRGYVWRRV